MDEWSCKAVGALALSLFSAACKAPPAYGVGERVEPEVYVQRESGMKVRLLDLAGPETQVLCLILFGGAHGEEDEKKGGLWCEDSHQDLPLLEEVQRHFLGKPVRFVPVACPPVYDDGGFGKAREKFLDAPEESAAFRDAAALFVRRTERLREEGRLPFDEVFYDLRFRLLRNFHRPLPAAGALEPWEGRFKRHEDRQTYGTPTIWLLGPDGLVLARPFWGNNYPGNVRYDAAKVVRGIEKVLPASAVLSK